MARKVFISFLGTTNYSPTNYFFGEENNVINNVRFIQEASIQLLCNDWNENDKVLILLTKDSRKKNWQDDGHLDQDTKEIIKLDGLESRLNKLELNCKIGIPLNIPDGKNENEVWEIFQTIYNELEEEDVLTFDITHSFRFMPMLNMVLINYAKFLKNIQVERITYGNWEGRDKEKNMSEIVDITNLSKLQSWTNAAHEFVVFGRTNAIAEMMGDFSFADKIAGFSDQILTVRGKEIYHGNTANELLNELKEETKVLPIAFNPLLKMIQLKLEEFEQGNVIKNGIAAIDYCIDHNLYQQGITILTEFIITYVLIYLREDWEELFYRDAVSSALSLNKKEGFNIEMTKNNICRMILKDEISQEEGNLKINTVKTIVEQLFNLPFKKKLSDKVFKKLSLGLRHDINHSGIRQEPKEIDYIKGRLIKYFEETKKIINNYPCS